LADVLIRTLDLCGSLGIDITSIVAEKLRFNETRPPKHGRNF
jgi:NTP pyrophosphatase (non-canonical NTP hydrolase)